MRSPELLAALQRWLHQWWAEGKGTWWQHSTYLMQPGLPLAAFVTGEHCCSVFNLVSTRTHSPHICFTSCLPQLVLVEGVILLQWQDFAFPFVLSRHPLSHCADHLIIESCHANQALHFLLYKSMVTTANHLLNIFSDSFQHYLLHFLSRDWGWPVCSSPGPLPCPSWRLEEIKCRSCPQERPLIMTFQS